MRKTLVALLLLAVAAPLAASEPTPCGDDLATLLAAPAQTPAEFPADLGTPEALNLSACTDECLQQFIYCSEECSVWHYPLCGTDCRIAKANCVLACQ